MNLLQDIKKYKPYNQQETCDKECMIDFITHHNNYLDRENQTAHFSTSVWTVNKENINGISQYL